MAAPPSTRARGQLSEDLAARFLEARGLVVVARNARAGGVELDIIALAPAGARDTDPQGPGSPTADRVDTAVFVEVRSREDDRAGLPEETVDARKQSRLRRGALAWLIENHLYERVAVRFDVVGVLFGDPDVEAPKITWIPGAFEAT